MRRLVLSIAAVWAVVSVVGAGEDPYEPLLRRATGLSVVGERVLVAGSGGLGVWDLATGEVETSLMLTGGCVEVVESAGLVLVACGPQGLAVARLGEPGETPQFVSRHRTSGAVVDVAAAGEGRFVLADGAMGVRLVELGEAGTIREIAHLDLGVRARGVSVRGEHAFVAAGRDGLLVLEIGQTGLGLRARVETVEARDLAFIERGERLLGVLADGVGGLALLDLGVKPRILERIPRAGVDRVRAVAVSGALVASAEGTSGLRLFRLTEDDALVPLREDDLGEGAATDVAFFALESGGDGGGERLVVAGDRSGLIFLDVR